MTEIEIQSLLLPSLKRALSGTTIPSLRQASIEADCDEKTVNVRYQVDDGITADQQEALSIVTTEVVADFSEPWQVSEEVLDSKILSPLAHIGYIRFGLTDE